MNSIQLEVIPHQTQEGMLYQHLHFQIVTDDGIITPEDLEGLKLPENIQRLLEYSSILS
jgi:CRISPR-associated protein Csx3